MLGVVPVGGDVSLALAELRGLPLLAYAIRSVLDLTPAVVVVADSHDDGLFHAVRDMPSVVLRFLDDAGAAQLHAESRDVQVLLHDPRCPLLPAAELRRVAGSGAAAAVGVRPVTDTVKTVVRGADADLVSETVDRDDYRAVCSPLSLSPAATAILDRELGPTWWTRDVWVLVATLRPYLRVDLVEVSSRGRRVEDEDALGLLESIDDVGELARWAESGRSSSRRAAAVPSQVRPGAARPRAGPRGT